MTLQHRVQDVLDELAAIAAKTGLQVAVQHRGHRVFDAVMPSLSFHQPPPRASGSAPRREPLRTYGRTGQGQPIASPLPATPRPYRASGTGQISRAGTGASLQPPAPSGSTRQARLPATTLKASCSSVPT